jgi:hypothetical membrane protein
VIKKVVRRLKQYSGVVGVLVLWTGIATAMHRTGLGLIDRRPISHLGVDPASAMLFSGSLLISAFLFINFAYYIKRTFGVTNRFMTYFLIGQAGQIIAAITPYGEGSPYKLAHTIAAFTLAFSLPLLIQQFAASQTSSAYHNLYVRLLRFEQLTFVIGIGLFVFTEGIAPLGEALPTIGFHTWIIVVTLISYRAGTHPFTNSG